MTARPEPTGPTALTWRIVYEDGAEHNVTARPGDYDFLEDKYPDYQERVKGGGSGMKPMLYLAWLASRHDPTIARPDFDKFRMEAVTVEMAAVPVRPTDAAPGRGSLSSLQLPPEPHLVDGSTPIRASL